MYERVTVRIAGITYGGYLINETKYGYTILIDRLGKRIACAKHEVTRWMRA